MPESELPHAQSAQNGAQHGGETWLERERRLTAERVEQLRLDDARRDAEFRARLDRVRAHGCDDGRGVCRFCGVTLGVDATGAQTHVDNRCPGPPRLCSECGAAWVYDAATGRWNPSCTAAEHDDRKRDAAWTLAVRDKQGRDRDPTARAPLRVHRDGDDDD